METCSKMHKVAVHSFVALTSSTSCDRDQPYARRFLSHDMSACKLVHLLGRHCHKTKFNTTD